MYQLIDYDGYCDSLQSHKKIQIDPKYASKLETYGFQYFWKFRGFSSDDIYQVKVNSSFFKKDINNYISAHIWQTEDEWFIVNLILTPDYKTRKNIIDEHYKCDQIDGLIQFIKDKFK